MRKGLLAGLSGLVCVAAVSCGKDEPNPIIEIPDAVHSASTAIAMRITGPYGPNDDFVIESLGKILSTKVSFEGLVTRGGLPDGPLTADPAGSAPQQVKALIDNGGFLAAEDAVDLCGNPMLAAFITPDMAQEVFSDASPEEITGQSSWPGVCAADLNCNTTVEGPGRVAFSLDHGNGARDLVAYVGPIAGPSTVPGYQGHLIGFMLTANNAGNHMTTAALYGNARSITVSAFGLVQFAKAGISFRPSLPIPGMPTRVWKFPADERELAGADLIVGVQGYEFCSDSWAATFGSLEPYGCDQLKGLVLDLSSRQGFAQWTETDSGDDIEKVTALGLDLDDWIAAWQYQLKAQIACPDVTEPSWVREDIPLGSVEVFQCPDGELDPCIAYHDMEDYWCELPPITEETLTATAKLPEWIGGSDEYAATTPFEAHTTPKPQTITYNVGSASYTIEWTLDYEDVSEGGDSPLLVAAVVAELNKQDAARPDSGPQHLLFAVDGDSGGIIVEPMHDFGPAVGFEFTGSGTLNARLGLTGASTHAEPSLAPVAADYYTLTAEQTTLDFAYFKISGSASNPTTLYANEPGRILGFYNSSGGSMSITPRTDGHCPSRGTNVWEITGETYVKLDITTDGEDDMNLIVGNMPIYIQ